MLNLIVATLIGNVQNPSDFAFERRTNLVVIEATVANKKGKFIVDTGTDASLLTAAFAKDVMKHSGQMLWITVANGKSESLPFKVLPDSSDIPNLKVDGFLGMDYLDNKVLTIDFERGRISIAGKDNSSEGLKPSAQSVVKSVPMKRKPEGVYVFEQEGKDYVLDTGVDTVWLRDLDATGLADIGERKKSTFIGTIRQQQYIGKEYQALGYAFCPLTKLGASMDRLFPTWKPAGVCPANQLLSRWVRMDFSKKTLEYVRQDALSERTWGFSNCFEVPLVIKDSTLCLGSVFTEPGHRPIAKMAGWRVVALGDEVASDVVKALTRYSDEDFRYLARIISRRSSNMIVLVTDGTKVQRLNLLAIGKSLYDPAS